MRVDDGGREKYPKKDQEVRFCQNPERDFVVNGGSIALA
jgi:hypothetical protein